jgi:hypothetical protein
MASAAGAWLEPEHFGVGMATMRMISQLGSAVGISMAVTAAALGGFRATYAAALVVSLGSVAAMTLVVPRPGAVEVLAPGAGDTERRRAERARADEIDTETALSLPVLEG